jgi:hypothetical protein
MLKLELNEVTVILQVLKETAIKGENAPIFADIIKKLVKEIEKLQPDTLVK